MIPKPCKYMTLFVFYKKFYINENTKKINEY